MTEFNILYKTVFYCYNLGEKQKELKFLLSSCYEYICVTWWTQTFFHSAITQLWGWVKTCLRCIPGGMGQNLLNFPVSIDWNKSINMIWFSLYGQIINAVFYFSLSSPSHVPGNFWLTDRGHLLDTRVMYFIVMFIINYSLWAENTVRKFPPRMQPSDAFALDTRGKEIDVNYSS